MGNMGFFQTPRRRGGPSTEQPAHATKNIRTDSGQFQIEPLARALLSCE
jgi:hypothetical protein